MRTWLLAATASALLFLGGAARAASPADDWHNFGLGTGDQCTAPVSIDGDLAAVEDQRTGRLYYYDFRTGRAADTGLSPINYESRLPMVSGQQIAYCEQGPWTPYGYTYSIHVYDVPTGQVLDTGITTAERPAYWRTPGRYFDGQKIAYRDAVDGHLKLYYLATGTTADTGIDGRFPAMSGNYVAYQVWPAEFPWWPQTLGLYDIAAGTTRDLGPGSDPQMAGDVVAYWKLDADQYQSHLGELCYYRVDTGATVPTGIVGRGQHSTDGASIAVANDGESIKILDLASGVLQDTGQWACTQGDACWVVLSRKYLAYERWEGGTLMPGTGEEIYPPTDYNGDGVIASDCVALWFSRAAMDLRQLIQQVEALNLSHGIENSLDAKLLAAEQALSDVNQHNDAAAIAALDAFIDSVQTQSGQQIPTADADALIAAAQRVLRSITGS